MSRLVYEYDPEGQLMKHLEVCVPVTIKPTESRVDTDRVASQVGAGQFRLVLAESSVFDIDALEAVLLETGYVTMRAALASVLEEASWDAATAASGEKGGPAAWSGTQVTPGLMGK